MSRPTVIATGSYSSAQRGRGHGVALHRLTGGSDARRLEPTPSAQAAAEDAGFLLWSADGSLLYAVTETSPSHLLTFAVDEEGSTLDPVGDLTLTGSGACHLAVGSRASTLVIAHYGSGQVETVALDERGVPVETIDVDDHRTYGDVEDPGAAPHPHQVLPLPGTDLIAVTDLGLDRVFLYRQGATGQLDLAGEIVLPAGSGPRHLATDHESQLIHIAGELSGRLITAVRGDAEAPVAGAPQVLQGASHPWRVRSALAVGEQEGAHTLSHVELTADEGFLLVADRDPAELVLLSLHASRLQIVTRIPVGAHPRHFTQLDDLILVAAQEGDQIQVLRRRGERIEQAAEPVSAPSVACIAPRP